MGLISGTSADGIDAALVRFGAAQPELVAARIVPYAPALRVELLAVSQAADTVSLDAFGRLDHRVGLAFAEAAQSLIEHADVSREAVRAIGSHGQTLRHVPHGAAPFTLQVGDPNLIAERTGITTVADFRRRDMAAGGQGAPLMPAFHAAMLASPDEDRVVLNLGGIANVTLLPRSGTVTGFDTGPANGLMDAWTLRHRGAGFDADGRFASEGRVDAALLARLLADPYFALPAPKSTGRDRFHLDWLLAHRPDTLAPADVQATLLELSAVSVADAVRRALPGTRRVLACGGGVRNGALMARLAALLPQVEVSGTAAYGIDADFMEAMGFAWLARETLAGRPGNLPGVTGARGPRVLGAVYPGA
nr:anhydro-N-acetylmuramic acid kinase [Chiayiivirga flava]